ncbi:DEAD/DEAH box RNA helicase [Hortaea werneckii]|uniref:RNA helicase n=1 Tax=Hortaea werneckii TaxID=91943 RepID=A0A3M7EX50_HORWE|nr:DEAD/DEAH box RNA helicase [Hortaea werneckii]KAI7623383.1 DEAD/DEAH box RNA helicase [Hortaea werneckii]KAI7629550.1 DEAD/DEAH box RNA helicase [Hortaea werneckii]KAI7676833.1 DEAD/DEAH box RNA helicase [Hortaea werneckii]KAI7710650.1 DEAD/DEAH box RNA helicase [Hortaea werneckii]
MSDDWGTTAPTEGGQQSATSQPSGMTDQSTNGNDWGTASGNEAVETQADEAQADADTTANPSVKFEALTLDKDEFVERARAAGWTETTAYDYVGFQRTGASNTDWHGAARVYEWKDEYGDVAPPIPELEVMLFGGEFQMRRGEHMESFATSTLTIQGNGSGTLNRIDSVSLPLRLLKVGTGTFLQFEDAGLHPVVFENIKLARYVEPTPIQSYCIPAILEGKDVVAVAQTGSGKTSAYMIPVLSRLMGKAKKLAAPKPNTTDANYNPRFHKVRAEPLVVIVVPTRELAVQIFDEARRMCYRSMLRPCVTYGGLPKGISLEELGKGCDIFIATPGRLCDLMDQPDVLTMSRVKYTIIDEADEMLHSDWEAELNKIMAGGDTNEDADHVYLMFSATFPKQAREMARRYMAEDYTRIRLGRSGAAHKNIRQHILYVDQDQKKECLYDLLVNMEPGRTMVFCNSKSQVDLIDDFLYNRGLPSTSIHSDRNQLEREDAIRNFRTGKAPILVATGVSARGWDVAGVKCVINFDLPSTMYGGIDEYIHRIGRTARIGHQGLATSFYNDRNEELAQDLVKVLIECECEVPDFLAHLIPEDGKIEFDDDTDEDEGNGDGFDQQPGGADASGVAVEGAWGPASQSGGHSGVAGASAWGPTGQNGGDNGGFTADGDGANGGAAAASAW